MPKITKAARRAELEELDRDVLIALILKLDDLTDQVMGDSTALADKHASTLNLAARQAKTISELCADPGQLALFRTDPRGRA